VGKTATPTGTPPWLFYTVAGGAVAALGVASGIAVNANSLNNQQTGENPYVRDPGVKNSIQSQATIANVLFGTGGALGLGAVVLVFTTKWKSEATPEPTVSLTPWIAPEGAGVGARASF
jgi:hypothetical protein